MNTLIEKLDQFMSTLTENEYCRYYCGINRAKDIIQSEPPYGQWLTGNEAFLKSLPIGTIIAFQEIRKNQQWFPLQLVTLSSEHFDIKQLAEGYRYYVFPPVHTAPDNAS